MFTPNDVGQFVIGQSQVGTHPPIDWRDTIYSQYANSPIIQNIIECFADTVNGGRFADEFYDSIWNLQTAVGYGLDVWGRILNIGRIIPVPITYFGFDEWAADEGASEAELENAPFNQAPFYSGTTATNNYALSDDAYRTLLWAKALSNISDSSILSINRIMRALFPGRGICFVSSVPDTVNPFWGFEEAQEQPFNQAPFYTGNPATGAMAIVYNFHFKLTPVELTIVSNGNVLPRPTGVSATVSTY